MQLIKSLSAFTFLTVAFAMPSQPGGDPEIVEAENKLINSGIDSIPKLVELVNEQGDAEDRGIVGLVLDLLTGSPPEASPTRNGLVVHTGPSGQFHQNFPGTGYGGGYPYF